jgi:L-amino acid N-acyltransferase YncA
VTVSVRPARLYDIPAITAIYRPRAACRWSVENSIYVAPEAQRMGAGRLLLQALIHDGNARGYPSAGSISLHKALGFTNVGKVRSVGFKHGRWLDKVVMQRSPGPGDATAPDDQT